MTRNPGLFKSYWMAGYEGADHVNGKGIPQSLNDANHHNNMLAQDYDLLKPFNIKTIRESVGWRLTEQNDQFFWDDLDKKAGCAQRKGLQVIWTLMHYGWPKDIDPFGPKFVSKFARFCEAVAVKLKPYHDEAPIYQPLNEISFLSWAITHTGLIHPFNGSMAHRGYELKRQLVMAALKGTEAIWSVDPRARIIHTDPLINIVSPYGASIEQLQDVERNNEYAFQAWDMLSGLIEPGLGGSKQHLDIIGLNYYHDNQWEYGTNNPLHWHLKDPRRIPLNVLASFVWKRYERPMVIAETSHVGEGRGEWISDIAQEVLKCEKNGIPIEGICLYPIIDRPDWENPEHWHKSGVWDVHNFDSTLSLQSANPNINSEIAISENTVLLNSNSINAYISSTNFEVEQSSNANYARILNQPYADALKVWQHLLPPQSLMDCLSKNPISGDSNMQTIIVFSHLRWNFVYQRPQHLLSRMAKYYQIIFVEEPVNDAFDNFFERFTPHLNVEVLRPHLVGECVGFEEKSTRTINELLVEFLSQHEIRNYWLWFYTPLALGVAHNLSAEGIVYDCMDELSAFKNASPFLIQSEDALFEIADIVFTGGPSLYQSKRYKHENVYCFASSVDAAHYAPKKSKVLNLSAEINAETGSSLGSEPVKCVGYFGVIDERIDIELIAKLADAHPEWQIIMVGPVVKIDHETLPRNTNIQWLGQKSYEELPDLIQKWDLCMMPFALNESTRFISPTKTLEYMAAERPIVSTNIKDVAEPYGHVVPIAMTHEDFIDQCEKLLDESDISRMRRIKTMREIVAKTSWDKTAHAMQQIIADFVKELELVNDEKALGFLSQNHSTEHQYANLNRIETNE